MKNPREIFFFITIEWNKKKSDKKVNEIHQTKINRITDVSEELKCLSKMKTSKKKL